MYAPRTSELSFFTAFQQQKNKTNAATLKTTVNDEKNGLSRTIFIDWQLNQVPSSIEISLKSLSAFYNVLIKKNI